MTPASNTANRYRTTKNILVPKGTRVIFISHIRQDAYRLAQALVNVNPDMQFEWTMNYDDAMTAGLIERVDETRKP